jgi:hypothetical protein
MPEAVIGRAPDIIIGSWCGKKFVKEKVVSRPGFDAIPAVRSRKLYEIKSALILQPGPAALTDGLLARDNPVLGALASGKLGKDVDATGDGDQFGDPGNAGYHRLVPFLEIHARTLAVLRAPAPRVFEIGREPLDQCVGALRCADERAKCANHLNDAGDRSLI